MLLAEGYHITLLPTTAQRDAAPKARVRALGVDVVTPVTKPDKWRLTHRGRCLFDAAWVATQTAFQARTLYIAWAGIQWGRLSADDSAGLGHELMGA